MAFIFNSDVIFWHGPAPFIFGAIPLDESKTIKMLSSELSYGWGCIPVIVKIGITEWKTSLFPKDDQYLIPIKIAVQKAERIRVGDVIKVSLDFMN